MTTELPEPTRRLAIVEDHAILAHTVGVALRAEGIDVHVAPVVDRAGVLAAVADARPRLTLLDLDLGPGVGDGTALIPDLLALGTDVLVVSGVTERTRLAAALEAGALGYVAKNQPFDDLLAALLRALDGGPVLDPNERHRLLAELRRSRADARQAAAPFERLTPRERQVLAALGNGQSVDAIAHAWVVSEATVRTQVRGVLTKLGVSSQLAAVAMARRTGWLSR